MKKYRKATGDETTINPSTSQLGFKRIAIGILVALGGIFLIDAVMKSYKKA